MLPGWGPVLLIDNRRIYQGSTSPLDRELQSTLEETRQADLLLHVADASNPNVLQQIFLRL